MGLSAQQKTAIKSYFESNYKFVFCETEKVLFCTNLPTDKEVRNDKTFFYSFILFRRFYESGFSSSLV